MADIGAGSILSMLLNGGVDIYNALGGGGRTDRGTARDAAAMADPFASQRPGYQAQLHGLLTDPGSFKADPGYQFALGQGQDAIKGAGNALYGGTRAGAIYPELAKYTEGYAAQNYDARINQLLTASGATSGSPGTAGALYARGGELANNDLGSGITNLLAGLLGGPAGGGGILGGLLQSLLGGRTGSIPSDIYGNYATGPGAPQLGGPGGSDYGGPANSTAYPGGGGMSGFDDPNWNSPGGYGDIFGTNGSPADDINWGDFLGGGGGGGDINWGDLFGWQP